MEHDPVFRAKRPPLQTSSTIATRDFMIKIISKKPFKDEGIEGTNITLISGMAGLMLGLAILEPGRYSRVDALRLAGREAVVLMLGVVVFLVFAGLVEGFFSPAVMPPLIKLIAAAMISLAFWGYLLLAGREPVTRPTAA